MTAQWCSFVCIARTRTAAPSGKGHISSPVFTNASVPAVANASYPLGPFALCGAFPRSDYYDPSAPPCPRRRTTHQPGTCRLWPRRRSREPHGGSHVHCQPIGGLGAQLCPCDIATATPQAFTVASPANDLNQQRSFQHPAGIGAHRRPAHIHRIGAGGILEKLLALVPRVHLPALLDGPGPSGSTGPSRRCRGCLPPHRRFPVQAAPSFVMLLRQHNGEGLPPPLGKTAPRGARGRPPNSLPGACSPPWAGLAWIARIVVDCFMAPSLDLPRPRL